MERGVRRCSGTWPPRADESMKQVGFDPAIGSGSRMTLHDDIQAGNLEALRAHLANGGAIDARGTQDRTLLHMAAQGAQAAMVEALLAHGAQVDALDYRRHTPLHHAAGMGCAAAVRALLDAGADATAKNCFDDTPLQAIAGGGASASSKDGLDIVDRLLAAGADLEAADTAGRTPLWFAAATGTVQRPAAVMKTKLAILERLLERGADPSRQARGKMGTPIDAARGLHQAKKYRIEWAEAVAALERHRAK